MFEWRKFLSCSIPWTEVGAVDICQHVSTLKCRCGEPSSGGRCGCNGISNSLHYSKCGCGNPFLVGFLWWRQGTPADVWNFVLLAGDVETSPGPISYPCSSCFRKLSCRDRATFCVDCKKWAHRQCAYMINKSIIEFADGLEAARGFQR